MFDAETTALLRAVLEEVCENISVYESGARTHVASKILEAAANGQLYRLALAHQSASLPARCSSR
ncbi:hypothetical protein [Bradyrhizobium sp. Ash2021]|uniref:hypothetical protein n=1 Tax=Bradyrhizobium sp. Ash2021 TaxID=2954771 RepID=UPI0028160455|nr:hypothetical protein [Bradyrhizobium sp. Ash2021]WMT78231.1 hypothetical protein NL528_18630 [Bradyrhizobium sp. Ash2021]